MSLQNKKQYFSNLIYVNIQLLFQFIFIDRLSRKQMGSSCKYQLKIQSQYSNPPFIAEKKQGKDHRNVANSEQLSKPYCNIGLIIFTYKNEAGDQIESRATGTLINPRLVLTSAHTFFGRDSSSQIILRYKPKKFYYKIHGLLSQFKGYDIDDFRINLNYESVKQHCQGQNFYKMKHKSEEMSLIQFDYALILLKTPVDNAVYTNLLVEHQLQQNKKDKQKSNDGIMFGYSDIRVLQNQENNIIGINMVGHRNKLLQIKHGFIRHNIDSSFGQSGSPLFACINSKNKQQYYSIGVHSGCFNIQKSEENIHNTQINYHDNFATYLSDLVIKDLHIWEKQMIKNQDQRLGYNIYKWIHQKVTPVTQIKNIQKPKPAAESKINKPPQIQKPKIQVKSLSQFDTSVYQKLRISFDLRARCGHHYSVDQNLIKRKFNLGFGQNYPFQLVSNQYIPNKKCFIELKMCKYSAEDPIVIGFINQFRRIEDQYSGLMNQKECCSIWLYQSNKLARKGRNFLILVDGEPLFEDKRIINEGEDRLRIYIDLPLKMLYWKIGQQKVISCPIPQSVWKQRVLFFIGLNNTQELVQLIA